VFDHLGGDLNARPSLCAQRELELRAKEARQLHELCCWMPPVARPRLVRLSTTDRLSPAGLQSYLVFMAVVSSASKNADAARSLIKFLTAHAAAPVFKAKGSG